MIHHAGQNHKTIKDHKCTMLCEEPKLSYDDALALWIDNQLPP